MDIIITIIMIIILIVDVIPKLINSRIAQENVDLNGFWLMFRDILPLGIPAIPFWLIRENFKKSSKKSLYKSFSWITLHYNN